MTDSPRPYAEDLPYWKTGQSEADTWIDKAEALIVKWGGEVTERATARQFGTEAILLAFRFGDDTFRSVWPVLESRTGAKTDARRQAATMLHHDVKARGLRLKIWGARYAFFDSLVLPNGRRVAELSGTDLDAAMPPLITEGSR